MVQLYKRKGGEILVNTATANNQSGGNIALLPGGGFVIAWSDGSMTGTDTSSFAVRAQRFDAAGNPVGGEFLVNSTVTGNQSGPTVATLASGRFVITWSDTSATGGDTSGIAVRGQIFEADGTPVGNEFLINTATTNNQSIPMVAELSGGGFVVAWLDNSGVGGDTSGTAVKAQIFNAAGAPVGGEVLANTTTFGSQGGSGINVIGLPGGGFAIAYSTTTSISGEAHGTIWVQQFDAAGTKVGGETVVNGDTLGNFTSINITALNAGFIVTWAQQDSAQFPGNPVTYNVRAQMFDAAGARLGAEFVVNTTLTSSQTNADVDRLPGGGFLITWQGPAEGATDLNIYGQFFDDNGARVGGEFVVNTVTDGSQTGARIEVLPSGDIVIVWTDSSATGADASGSGVKMQILTLSSDAPTDIALSDTSISETAIENLAVATLSATNGAAVNSHFTYTIVSDASGGAFRIEGDKLVVGDGSRLDFETQPNVQVRIRATDLNGMSYEETLTIAVGDVVTETRYAAGDEIVLTDDSAGFNGPLATVALAGGGYAVLINHVEFSAGDTFRVQIRDAAGLPVGTPVDFEPAGFGGAGMVAEALADGGFVVAYRGGSIQVGNGNGFPIRLQMFDASGQMVGGEILASTTNGGILGDPDIALLDNGNFVVSWTLPVHEDGSDGGPFPSQIMARIFDGTGFPVGGEFRVNTGIEGGQVFSHVAALADGGFVVTWREGTAVEAQIFDNAGAKVGGERVVVAEGAENSNLVALDNGTFLVTWDDIVFEDDDVLLIGIFGQLVGADGVNIGGPITILPFGNAYLHHLEAMPGGFVVTWSEQTPDPSDDEDWLDSWARMYDLAGRPIGEAFRISPEGDNGRVALVAAADDGDLLFTWDHESVDASFSASSNMFARLFTRELPPSGPTQGPDVLNGTAGSDVIDGLGGNDVINGLAGDDMLIGGAGADILAGGADNDFLFVDNAGDVVLESVGEGNDRVFASVSYTLGAGAAVELLTTDFNPGTAAINLTGNALVQGIFGNAGANQLSGGGGADTLVGFGGDDWYFITDGHETVFESGGGGNDRVFAGVSYTLAAGAEVELLTTDFNPGTAAINLTGNALVQAIFGNAGANQLSGGGGADTLVGFGGDDWYFITDGHEAVFESAGGGNDRVFAGVSYTLAAGAEVELITTDFNPGTAAINLTGNALAQGIFGNAGANQLAGGGGADTLVGFGGDDWYFITSGSEAVFESASGGSDRIFAGVDYRLQAGSEVELITTDFHAGTAGIDITGNELSQTIYGNAGGNILDGGAGKDVLIGNGGADIFLFSTALNTATGTAFGALAATANVDQINGFGLDDKIGLDAARFGLTPGTLAPGAFVLGTAAADADDRIIYDSATGALLFDADGSGAGAAQLFAYINGPFSLDATYFVVV